MFKLLSTLFFSFFMLFFIHGVNAQDSMIQIKENGKQMLKRLDSLSSENYLRDIASIRQDLENFLEKQTLFCSGDLAMAVGDANPSQRKKVSSQERKECFNELQEFHLEYVEKLFDVQKDYIGFQHEARLKEWEKSREAMLKAIKDSASK